MIVDRRLQRLEAAGMPSGIRGLIGRYFDELTEPERERWAAYRFGVDAQTVADVELAVHGDLHFLCDCRPKPPTKAEFEANLAEVEAAADEHIRQYNRERIHD